ncbi:MAG: nucleotidyltransferase domain-containing protein [Nitrosomonas sp.]|nr:nucleotidyltransferase domain-containing protein [Nitrosomonas sp.]
MRITANQLSIVKALARRYFGEDVKLWLFGSRVDDEKKGGDYDFLIETSLTNPDEIISSKIDMMTQLQSSGPFEDEKIDIIVKRRQSSFDMPIYHIAKQEGVQI